MIWEKKGMERKRAMNLPVFLRRGGDGRAVERSKRKEKEGAKYLI